MMKDENCAYCMQGELVAQFGYPCIELEHSLVFIFKEQSHKGRLIVASNQHVSELVDLSDEERNGYFEDIAKVAKAMHSAFSPDKINYGAYGDTGKHLHFHLVPKYKDGEEWGTTFAMNNGKVKLTDEEYEVLAEAIRSNIK
jgi:diadenosine tetraphosphate (Ap4A) HIT family hydrolase